MNWMFFILGAVALGAVILAIYERRHNKRMAFDEGNVPPHDRHRAAHTNEERIRAEGVALQNPGSGMP